MLRQALVNPGTFWRTPRTAWPGRVLGLPEVSILKRVRSFRWVGVARAVPGVVARLPALAPQLVTAAYRAGSLDDDRLGHAPIALLLQPQPVSAESQPMVGNRRHSYLQPINV
jgi:hypothetical protein